MATPKPLGTYPRLYKQLFLRALHEDVVIEGENNAEANAVRGRLYAFRTAILKELDYDPELSLAADALTFRIDGNKLIISNRERNER